MHMFVSGRESAEGNCWEGAAQQWRSTAQIAPSDPHPYMDFCRENLRHGDNSLTKQKNNGNELCCNSSTVKDDVSALLWVFWVPPKQSAHLHGTGRESDIKLYLHSKIQNYLSAMILCCVKF